jgi:hypothetical protein
MHKVFISYARADQHVADVIAERLASEGLSVSFDHVAIVAGESYSDKIVSEIRSASAVLALLSSTSRKSKWVATELQAALESETVVVAVLLDKGAKDNWLWPLLATRPSVELDLASADWKSQLDNLVRKLSAAMGKGQVARPAPSKEYIWISIAIAVASAVISALVTLLILHR